MGIKPLVLRNSKSALVLTGMGTSVDPVFYWVYFILFAALKHKGPRFALLSRGMFYRIDFYGRRL